MIKINLLPPEYKSQFEEKKTKFPIFLILFLSLVIILLSGTIIYISQELQDKSLTALQNQNNAYANFLDTDNNQNIEKDIKEIEKLSDKVKKVLDNKSTWEESLVEFSYLVPENITLYKLELRENNKINLVGFASQRQDLLEFESNLNESNYFNNVLLPSSYLISQQDITFRITLEVADNKIKYGKN